MLYKDSVLIALPLYTYTVDLNQTMKMRLMCRHSSLIQGLLLTFYIYTLIEKVSAACAVSGAEGEQDYP